ncbi:MAG: phosphate ABC transporter ATP-binding protein [Thermoleophilia bacterium]|jgi:putative ABC transport system ATP-binding protein|nr:phosphate ABC transporter ATP-binding protein [Thermoleophilia bacterium]
MPPAAGDALFSLEGVRVTGPAGERVLDGLSAEVPAAGVTVVAGPSGAGKTTLLRLCNRLEAPDAGVVRFRGDDVAGLDPLALRRRVGMVFQRPTPFGGTVRDNLRVADPAADDRACRGVLARAGLPPAFLDRDASTLSGGEAQRMCLARALMAGPEALLMDEPTASLDPAATAGLERLARDLAASGIPVVWVTHDLAQVRRIADRVLVLIGGRRADEAAARAFLEGRGG